ncbi:MAG: SGNH/GDSL hydrolase family protein [Bacteroidales bacterium]
MTKQKRLLILLLISLLLNITLAGIIWISGGKPQKKAAQTFTPAAWLTDLFRYLPHREGEIVFLGNSITQGFRVQEFFPELNIINRGVWGDRTDDILERLNEVVTGKPKAVFIMAGINDLLRGATVEQTSSNLDKIIRQVRLKAPGAKIIVQSVLPVEGKISVRYLDDPDRANDLVRKYNERIQQLCDLQQVRFVDLYPRFEADGSLDPAYSWDGIHPNGKGYLVWLKQISPILVEITDNKE